MKRRPGFTLEEIVNESPMVILWGPAEAGRSVNFVTANISRFGYSAEEMVRDNRSFSSLVFEEDRATMEKIFSRALTEQKETLTMRYRLLTACGDVRWIEDRTVFHRDEGTESFSCQSSLVEVTKQKNAEERLEQSEKRLERVLAEAKVGVWEYYPERDEIQGSGRSTLYGIDTNGPVNRSALWDRIIPSDLRPLMESKWDAALSGKEPVFAMEHEVLRPDGERRWILSKGYPQRNLEGQVTSMKGLVLDLTSLRRTELDLQRQKKRLSLAHSMLMAFMEELDRERLLHSLLEKVLEFSGSAHGCISLLEPDGATLRLTFGTGLFASMVGLIHPVESGLSGEVLRRGERVRVRNYGAYHLRRDDPRLEGLTEVIGLPIYREGKLYGAVTIASYDHLSILDDEILSSLDQFGAAASIALENARLFEDLRASFKDLVRTMGEIVGKKDPYTIAHQSRVADLACAMAGKLGLEADMKEGIRIASLVHDIGKAEVPGEILSKPGRLSSIEFDLIKTHAASGYEILRSIAFPWPVAEITYQHHERMNGSGYPRGLPGEDILPEARILAVADVVEAMVSHRPYRPALGIDAALEEIRSGRGTLYDPSVVDACLEVFEENPSIILTESY